MGKKMSSNSTKQYSDFVKIKGKKVKVWPDDMEVSSVSSGPSIYHTRFNDYKKYEDKLINRILELEKKEDFTHRFEIGGSKVRYVHTWGIPEAELINARATSFFCQAVGRNDAVITASWARDLHLPRSSGLALSFLAKPPGGSSDHPCSIFRGLLTLPLLHSES